MIARPGAYGAATVNDQLVNASACPPEIVACSVTASLAWQSRIDVDTSFGYLLPAFMILGVGMGFSMSPMSTR